MRFLPSVRNHVPLSCDECSEPKCARGFAGWEACSAPLQQSEWMAALRKQTASSFLSQDREVSLCQADQKFHGSCKARNWHASFFSFPGSAKNDLRKTPRLKPKVQIRLQFQTPEIYATDVALEVPFAGPMHGCLIPDAEGKGEPGLIHPEITFNALPPIFGGIREVHVHLEDLTTNQVFWDADFKLPMFDPLMNLVGKTRLKKYSVPKNLADVFHKPCVARDDMRQHFFDLSIRTLGKYWDETLQEWRPNTGFKGNGPEAHIGFMVQRMPELSFDGKSEQLGLWRAGSSYAAAGDVIEDPFERMLAGDEDPFYDRMKGITQRGYYDYIITKGGRTKDRFDYLAKYGPPLLLGEPPSLEDDDESGLGLA